jgi:hypothetical protein
VRSRGPGRPAIGDAARSSTIQIRVTVAEATAIRRLAREAGVSVSDYAREQLIHSR